MHNVQLHDCGFGICCLGSDVLMYKLECLIDFELGIFGSAVSEQNANHRLLKLSLDSFFFLIIRNLVWSYIRLTPQIKYVYVDNAN